MNVQSSYPFAKSPELIEKFIWALIGFGLLALFIPTASNLFKTVWAGEEQAHGPIIFVVAIWLMYRKLPQMKSIAVIPALLSGMTIFIAGLACYFLGRSQAIIQFEVAALIPLLISLILLFRGPAALKVIWFPIFFLIFMIPLPGIFVQAITVPLKIGVSYVAEFLLFNLGYPIARMGVILQVGPYQLLVADACAGLHTMFTLEALGLLYMNLMGHVSITRNTVLAILIIPISFTANVIRVIALILITYHFGDEAGQGFLHGFAGMVLFVSALILIFVVDGVLGRWFPSKPTTKT
ncbi:MAG: exosortase B [Pseudomonadota bacterium]